MSEHKIARHLQVSEHKIARHLQVSEHKIARHLQVSEHKIRNLQILMNIGKTWEDMGRFGKFLNNLVSENKIARHA